MFTIIGGDDKEYGPVTADQIRAWIASGRSNLDTMARKTGESEWKRLGDFAEFAPGRARESAYSEIPAGPVDPKAYADALIARAGTLDIGGCLERSWELLKAHLWPLVGTTFVVVVVAALASSIPKIGVLISMLLGGVFYGGLYLYYLKTIRGQPVEFGDAFSGFSVFLPLMLAGLVVSLLTGLGLLLLVLPGIYLAVAYAFSYLLVIDRKMDFWPAMEVSRRVITAQWWRMFGLLLLGGLIAGLGLVGLLIGVFFTIPIAIGALVYAYEDLCNPPRN